MLTLVTYILIMVYLGSKVNAFFSKSDQVENVNKIKVDLFEQDTVYMNETEMQLLLFTKGYIPPSIGSWKARRVIKAPDSIFGLETQEIELGSCDSIKNVLKDYFDKRIGEELFELQYQITSCLTDGWMKGDFLQKNY